MMTKEELEDVLHQLGLDYEAEADRVYVFYALPDGRIDNFSLGLRRGLAMGDGDVEGLMRREYPATRAGAVVAVERPGGLSRGGAEGRWLDTVDVSRMLKVTPRTVRSWSREGWLRPHAVGRRVYFDRDEVDALLASNRIEENGRLDRTGPTLPRERKQAEESGNKRKQAEEKRPSAR